MRWQLWLALLVVFELAADVFAKEYSLTRARLHAVLAIALYVACNSCWLVALCRGSGLARGAILFSVSSAVLAVVLGVLVYRESLTPANSAGLLLGLAALALLGYGD
jgi:multidrug transporter EmrE-like cation transporter